MKTIKSAKNSLINIKAHINAFLHHHCYKFIFIVIIIFVFMQYLINYSDYRRRYGQTVNTGLTWISYNNNNAARKINQVSDTKAILSSAFQLATYNYTNTNSSLFINNSSISSSYNNNNNNSSSNSSNYIIKLNNSAINVKSNFTFNKTSLQICPWIPPKLVGRLKVLDDDVSFEQIEAKNPELLPGGRYFPRDCKARQKVAIIVPYRNRELHLRKFLLNIHQFLMRQQIDYGIFVIEQIENSEFNRAKLFNIGFKEALKQYDYDCFIFHDVDLIPEDDTNLYRCSDQPRHMSVSVNTMHYKLPYKTLFGGVSALTKKQMDVVNGFSNEYWGWGGEDDDMSSRIRSKGFRIVRYKPSIARYTMLTHKKDKPNPDRYKKLYSAQRRFKKDGLSNLNYVVIDCVFKKLFTWILVDPLSPK